MGEATLFGVKKDFDGPENDVGEGGVVGAGCGGEWVLRDLIREQRIAGGEWAERKACGGETGEVAGKCGAVSGDERGFHLAFFLEGKGKKGKVLLSEPGAQGYFYLGLAEEADFLFAKLIGTGEAGGDGDEKAYAVVEQWRAKGERWVAGVREVESLGWDQIDLAIVEGGGGGHVVRVGCDGGAGLWAEDCDGDGSADVSVEGDAGAVVVG